MPLKVGAVHKHGATHAAPEPLRLRPHRRAVIDPAANGMQLGHLLAVIRQDVLLNRGTASLKIAEGAFCGRGKARSAVGVHVGVRDAAQAHAARVGTVRLRNTAVAAHGPEGMTPAKRGGAHAIHHFSPRHRSNRLATLDHLGAVRHPTRRLCHRNGPRFSRS